MITDNSFRAFGESLRGELIEPDDQRYDTARKLYNGMIDRWPRAIARCADVSDMITAVRFAREHDLLLAVRGGGHNGGGLGSRDDGLVIDLSRMKGVRVDPARRTARERSTKRNRTVTFMIAWSVERAHFKVAISRSLEKGADPPVGVTQLDPMAFPNDP